MATAKKGEPRYALNVSMKAWDIAKAGAAVKLKVRDRTGLPGTVAIGQGTFGSKSSRARNFKRISWAARRQARAATRERLTRYVCN